MTQHHGGLAAVPVGATFNHKTGTLAYIYGLRPVRQHLSLAPPRRALQPPQPPSYLGLMSIGCCTYYYDIENLGFPIDPTPPQQTEPFWQQHDFVQSHSQPQHQYPIYGYTHYNHIYDPFGMQDFVPVFIGSNTADGKILIGNTDKQSGKGRKNDLLKLFGRVSLHIGDACVGESRVQDLVRFSKTVSAKYKSSDGQGEATTKENVSFAVEVTKDDDGLHVIKLMNSHHDLWVSPPTWAFGEVINWIDAVRQLPRAGELPQFGVVDREVYTLHELIDLYAATIALGLRPNAIMHDFRGEIFALLSYTPSTAENFQYLHEHLPVGDVVLKRMVTSFFVHGERNHYRRPHQRGEVSRVQKYVNECGHQAFQDMVVEIMDHRVQKRMAELEGGQVKAKARSNGKRKGEGKVEAVKAGAEGKTAAAVGGGAGERVRATHTVT